MSSPSTCVCYSLIQIARPGHKANLPHIPYLLQPPQPLHCLLPGVWVRVLVRVRVYWCEDNRVFLDPRLVHQLQAKTLGTTPTSLAWHSTFNTVPALWNEKNLCLHFFPPDKRVIARQYGATTVSEIHYGGQMLILAIPNMGGKLMLDANPNIGRDLRCSCMSMQLRLLWTAFSLHFHNLYIMIDCWVTCCIADSMSFCSYTACFWYSTWGGTSGQGKLGSEVRLGIKGAWEVRLGSQQDSEWG